MSEDKGRETNTGNSLIERIRKIKRDRSVKNTASYFNRLSQEAGPKTLEVINNEWNGIPYAITNRDSGFTPWTLRFTGIQLPKYDDIHDGAHNEAVRSLFGHLVAKELNWKHFSSPTNHSGEDGSNAQNTAQIPGVKVDDLTNGNIVARKIIDSYLSYKPKIDEAISELERVYNIDPTTRRSQDLGPGKSLPPKTNYPGSSEMLLKLKTDFGLDFINDWPDSFYRE